MRGLRLLLALAIVAVAPRLAESAIYVWHDSDGITHYVDNLDNVPAEHRAAATLLVSDWQRAAPQAEDPAPAPAAPAVPSADAISQAAIRSYEDGMWAGRESAIAAQPPPASVSLGPIVQNVEVLAPPQVISTFPTLISAFPVFGPVLPGRLRPRRAFVSPSHRRFIRGAAGEPPLGAAGPPPVGAAGPPPVFFVRQ